MASSQHRISKRMLPGVLSVIWALAAAAGSSATEPPAIHCPKINASVACACLENRVSCDGLRLSDLGFIAPSLTGIRTLLASHNDLRELPADFLPGATELQALTLSYNKIASIDGRFFDSLPSLVYLDLSYNKLAQFYLPQNGLPNLEILNLTNNILSSVIFDKRSSKSISDTQLNINRNNICGFKLHSVLSGNGLEQLYLSHNKIGNDLSFLRNLQQLKILTLGHNNISHVDPDLLPCDDTLRCLHLNNNLLSDLNFLKCVEYLDQLNVSSNVISAIPEDTFTEIILLQSLDIANNIIENSRFLKNVSPTTINFLNISHNKLSTIPVNIMMDKSELKCLDISYNEVTDISFAGDLKKLELLFAGNNKISQIDKRTFVHSRTIKNLKIGNNLLSNIDFLKQLPNITCLDLHNNQINRIDENSMSQLKKLENLDLSNNRISNVNFINEVPRLRSLQLSNNSVTQLPCNNFVQTIYLDGNDIRTIELSCVPNLRHLSVHGGVFKDRKEQELRVSKEVDLGINNHEFTFPCFPTLEVILKCKKQCSQTEADEIVCESHGTIFSNPIAIVIYCIGALLCSLVIFLIVARCNRLRKRKVDNNRECLCGKGEHMHRHHAFRSNELCW